ncbi:hypothetical protein [Roseateles puraquae]|uniref:hypothetical protein n=1 Tax=Roseateles puraquae TaxID=431059 RepID=UPI001184703B|nr:hypothetical protein [Roseateles puraquae]MDG0854770.1 hypothetical protein [Roseateles puraquae]
MKVRGYIFAVAALVLTTSAIAQVNSTFATRTPIFSGGGNGPVTITTSLNTNQQVENVLGCSYPRSAPNPVMTYGYNAWYSYIGSQDGYLEVRPQVFHADGILYYGSNLNALEGPLDKFAYGSTNVQYIRVTPGKEIIKRNCWGSNSPPGIITDGVATFRFLPGLQADLATATEVTRASQHTGFNVRAQVGNNTSNTPSGHFILTVTLESDRGFSIVPTDLGNGGTGIIGSDTYKGTGLNPTVSALSCAQGRCRMTVTFQKANQPVPVAGTASDGYYYAVIPVSTSSESFRATAAISALENPDPNLANNSVSTDYVPPPPDPGSSQPVGAGATVPTAAEWQLLIFGGALFAAAVLAVRGRQR